MYDGAGDYFGLVTGRGPLRSRYRRAVSRLVDGFLTNSARGEAYIREKLGARCPVLRVPYLWPSSEFLTVGSGPKGNSQVRFVYVGRLCDEKGIKNLLAAAQVLRLKGKRFSLTLVGSGPSKQEYERYIVDNELSDFVSIQPWVIYEILPLLLREFDVFVFPSLGEPWGMALLEAMACGLPVVASVWADSHEMIEDGETGIGLIPFLWTIL
jgi:glycosyltransferase involved in cell wall biosynthesis